MDSNVFPFLPPPPLAPAPGISSASPPSSRATLIGLVMGAVLVDLLLLIFVGICVFLSKRRMRRSGVDNESSAPSQPLKGKLFLFLFILMLLYLFVA